MQGSTVSGFSGFRAYLKPDPVLCTTMRCNPKSKHRGSCWLGLCLGGSGDLERSEFRVARFRSLGLRVQDLGLGLQAVLCLQAYNVVFGPTTSQSYLRG